MGQDLWAMEHIQRIQVLANHPHGASSAVVTNMRIRKPQMPAPKHDSFPCCFKIVPILTL